MQLTTFAIVWGSFLLFAISRAWLRFRDGTISFRQFIFWLFVWVGGGLIMLYPNKSSDLATTLGVGRGADAVVYISIIVLFYLAFRAYAALTAIQRDTTRLVRAIAIEEAEREAEHSK